MTVGWIKLHRLLLEKEIFEDAYALKVFLYLLLRASYKEMKVRVGNQVIVLQPGQLLYGRKSVGQRLNMGEGKLRGIMEYLVNNGSIEIESHSRYSIVTIVNWMQYQRGDNESEFPFDIDFLDDEDGSEDADCAEEYSESEPAENQMQMQTQTDFQDYEDNFLTNREPLYNNINKYKNNKITKKKTRENNNNINQNNKKENQNMQNHKNITNTQNIENISHYRQNESIVNDVSEVKRVVGLEYSQWKKPSGGGVAKGKVSLGEPANRYDTSSSRYDGGAIDARLLFDIDWEW